MDEDDIQLERSTIRRQAIQDIINLIAGVEIDLTTILAKETIKYNDHDLRLMIFVLTAVRNAIDKVQ